MKELTFNLELISKYRTEIMGFAAILIILCHANVAGVVTPRPVAYLLGLGNVGVDIFLFVSGIGMYYSLSKVTTLGGVKTWYKKRYLRIVPPYLIITLPWWIYLSITREQSIFHFLGEVSTLLYWLEHYGAWYVALLIPLYLVTPCVAKCIDYFDNDIIRWLFVVLLCVCLLIITSIQFSVTNEMFSAVIRNLQLAFSRVPIFIVGYGLAPYVKNQTKVSYMWVLAFPVMMWILSRMPFVSSWYRGWLLAIPFTMLFCAFMVLSVEYDKIRSAFHFIGIISLESYLANVFVTYALQEFVFWGTIAQNKNNYFFYTLVVVIGMFVAITANKIYNILLSIRKL